MKLGYRGLSIQSALCSHMMRHYGAKGFQGVLKAVVPENGPSRRKNEKCGFRPVEMIRFVRWDLNVDYCVLLLFRAIGKTMTLKSLDRLQASLK
jgi:L-amino acid N-acyltransferase YncA